MIALRRLVRLKRLKFKDNRVLIDCVYNTAPSPNKPTYRIFNISQRCTSSFNNTLPECELDVNLFEKVCEETLQSLTECFEELVESNDKFASGDITYSSGVLTVNLGKFGIYVINRQSPNKQIWLSSPISGPKRYDFVKDENYWIYRHNKESLHELLEKEISSILGEKVDFSKCLYAKV